MEWVAEFDMQDTNKVFHGYAIIGNNWWDIDLNGRKSLYGSSYIKEKA